MSEYKYNLSTTEKSSNEYGKCDICNKHCSEIFHQTEQRKYKLPEIIAVKRKEKYGYTHNNCNDYFGHKECLESIQR